MKQTTGPLPLAYEEYLRSIGKGFLFQFMDAETMAYEDLGHIRTFGKEVFDKNPSVQQGSRLVVSERRYDYISLIDGEGDNPKVWIMSPYWDDEEGENLTVRRESFTGLMNAFFSQTLELHPAGFYFVPSTVHNPEAYIRQQVDRWQKSLQEIKNLIDKTPTENPLVLGLNALFIAYYRQAENANAGSQQHPTAAATVHQYNPELEQVGNKKGLFHWLMNLFR